jgi:hypothetical protein
MENKAEIGPLPFPEVDGPPRSYFEARVGREMYRYIYITLMIQGPVSQGEAPEIVATSREAAIKYFRGALLNWIGILSPKTKEPLIVWRERPAVDEENDYWNVRCRIALCEASHFPLILKD